MPGIGLPTDRDDWRLVARTTRLVLSIPTYAAVAVLATVGSLSVFVLSRNLGLLSDLVVGGNLPLGARLSILLELYPLVGTDYTLLQSVALYATALLVGANLAMVVYHLREHRLTVREGSGSFLGVVLGTLGAGCAACGSAVLAGVLSVFGAGSLLTVLPLDGLEFSLLSLLVLVLSMYWIADGLRGGEVRGCPVDI